MKHILLHGHTRHVGRVQTPNVEATLAELLLHPVRSKAIKVSAHKSLGNPLGSVLSLAGPVATEDKEFRVMVED